MTAPIASPAIPDLRALLNQQVSQIFYALNCHEVAKIVSFDATKQTATVQIQVLRQLNDKQMAYPLLTDCPVFFNTGGNAALTMPIADGDTCLVLFNDRDLDNWFTSGSNVMPNSTRSHDLSDGLVIVGFRNLANVLSDYSSTDPELRNADGRFGIGTNGKISLRNSSGSFLTAMDTLFTGLDDLFNALDNWVDTNGDSPNPATLAAINAAKAVVDDAKSKTDALLK